MIRCTFETACILTCILLVLYLFVELVAAITTSHLLGILILLYALYMLLWNVGLLALYPGSFAYIRSDIEIRSSQRMAQTMMESFRDFFSFVQSCSSLRTQFLYRVFLVKHVDDVIKLLKRFDGTLSSDKNRLLRVYETMGQYLNGQELLKKQDGTEVSVLIRQFLWEPEKVRFSLGEQNKHGLGILAGKVKDRLEMHFLEVRDIVMKFRPPQQDAGPFKSTLYKLYAQKLFQVRFAYMNWENRFDYTIHCIGTDCGKEKLEIAIINKNVNTAGSDSRKAVMFCLPNGAYLQYFALESHYIPMYLELGYKVVLWNYRGYGQSTGEPALHKSMIDANTVYLHCRNQLSLHIQVLHGYSIGGPPATSLALRYPEKIKAFVIDRTFCDISKVAKGFSPILAKLCKLVMSKDSQVDCAEMFARARNTCKILIWADNDEIIANYCSLKTGVMEKMKDYIVGGSSIKASRPVSSSTTQQEEANIDSIDQSYSLAQNFESLRSKNISDSLFDDQEDSEGSGNAQVLRRSIEDLTFSLINLQKETQRLSDGSNSTYKEIYSKRNQGFIMQDQERGNNSNNLAIVSSILDKFWKMFQQIDGGGIKGSHISNFVKKSLKKMSRTFGNSQNSETTNIQEGNEDGEEQLQELSSSSSNTEDEISEKILKEVQSFVYGLLTYGCCFRSQNEGQLPRLKNFKKQNNSQQQIFGNNMNYTLEKLSQILSQYTEPINSQKHLHISLERVREILGFMGLYRDIIRSNLSKRAEKGSGILIPSNSGHNGDLSDDEMRYLKQLLTSVKEEVPMIQMPSGKNGMKEVEDSYL